MTKSKSFTFVFDESNPNFRETYEYNMLFLRNQLNFMNDVLYQQGYVFLNDVLAGMGVKRIPDGQLLGWITPKADAIWFAISIVDDAIEVKLMTVGSIYRSI